MPELPDVEGTRRYLLRQGLVGRRIQEVRLAWPRAVAEPSPQEFRRRLAGRRLEDIGRRAKFLLFALEGGETLAVHLRMSGALVVQRPQEPSPPYTHTVFLLDDGRELRYTDLRRFGRFWLLSDPAPLLAGLGPEPLEPDFTPQVLRERLGARAVPVKALLCDQHVVAGLGNIYADEALFVAGIPPLAMPADLDDAAVARLHRAIVEVLEQGIRTVEAMMPVAAPPTETPQGLGGLRVPREEGHPCLVCGTPIRRTLVRGRSAYWCPVCQGARPQPAAARRGTGASYTARFRGGARGSAGPRPRPPGAGGPGPAGA